MAQRYQFNQPDGAAVEELLRRHPQDAVGMIVSLAWQAGLLREEMLRLTWDEIDLPASQLLLPDRTVPLSQPLAAFLAGQRPEVPGSRTPVILSDRDRRPLTAQSVSRLARMALDEVGQSSVRLIDLRHDFVARQLQVCDWQYVSRICGIDAAALSLHFGAHLPRKKLSTRTRPGAVVDELRLEKLLGEQTDLSVALTVSLTWQMGLSLDEIVTLTWEQVTDDAIELSDRRVPLAAGSKAFLEQLAVGRSRTGVVILSPRAGKPFDKTRLSRMARAALIHAGLDDLTLRDLQLDYTVRIVGEQQLLAHAQCSGHITRREAAALLSVSPTTAYNRLLAMVQSKKLVRVGASYYPADAVVSPEEQTETIIRYLQEAGFAYRQDIARLLRLEPRQCYPILQRLVCNGTVLLDKQRYSLGQAGNVTLV